MRKLLSLYPTATRLVLFLLVAVLCFPAAFLISSFFPLQGMQYTAFSYYIIALLLLLLTQLLYKSEGKNLSAIGLDLKHRHLIFLASGFAIGLLFFCLLFLLQSLFNGLRLSFNPKVSYLLVLGGLLISLPQVLVEELIFRGYPFDRTVRAIGTVMATIVFALLFVIWHWAALNAWGSFGQMASLLVTGLGHILFAIALFRSGTLYFPIGIHLGNNWVSRYIFSYQTAGVVNTSETNDSLFIISGGGSNALTGILISYTITIWCFLLFTFFIWRWGKKRRL